MTLFVISICVLAAWFFCGAVLLGIGATVNRFLRLPFVLINSFWFGLATAIAILEAYHLFRRIDVTIVILLFLWGVAGIAQSRAALVTQLRNSDWQPLSLFALGIVLLVLALRASGTCDHYDTGLYGASTVRWFVTYPAVPGLANLHGRLAFNSALFPLLAALQQVFGTAIAFRLLDGLLFFIAALRILPACLRIFRSESGSLHDWFFAVLLIPLTFWIFRGDVVGSNTDLPATILALFAAHHLFRAFQTEPVSGDSSQVKSDALVAIALVSLAVTVKLSIAVFALVVWLLAVYKLQRLGKYSHSSTGQRLPAIAFAVPFPVLLPWMCHGLILSGYPAYPSSLLGIPADWKLPAGSLDLVRAGLRAWAREPFASIDIAWGWQWVHSWFGHIRADREGFLFPTLIAVCALALIVVRRLQTPRSPHGLASLVPLLCGLLAWFYLAPALRFAEAFLWGIAATLSAHALHSVFEGPRRTSAVGPRFVLVVIAAMALLCVYPRTLWHTSFEPVLQNHVFSPFPTPDSISAYTSSGTKVYIPRLGNQCWDAPLPCSAYLNPSLRMRKAGDLREGFASGGLPPHAEWIEAAQGH